MKPLAQSANVWTVVLEPAYLTDKEDQTLVANGLAEILGMEAQDIMDKMNPNSYYTILKKRWNPTLRMPFCNLKLIMK